MRKVRNKKWGMAERAGENVDDDNPNHKQNLLPFRKNEKIPCLPVSLRKKVIMFAYKKQMEFRTPVDIPQKFIHLTPQSRVMFVGSCFAEHIGEQMKECLPPKDVMVNPTGVVYNPQSILSVLNSLVGLYDETNLEQGIFTTDDGLWRHWGCSTKFCADSREALLAELTAEWCKACAFVRSADVLFITFSTDRAYCLKDGDHEGLVVANCHKQPAALFEEFTLDLNHQVTAWLNLFTNLRRANPDLKVVFTLSPYRYAKYGMHGNALAKACLLCFIDELCSELPGTAYFPAYEIVTDELRDYRFYAPDMLHPSAQAVDYVWQRFKDWTFDAEMSRHAAERQKLLKEYAHRPQHTATNAYRRFVAEREERRVDFEAKWHTPLFE